MPLDELTVMELNAPVWININFILVKAYVQDYTESTFLCTTD